MGDSSLLPGMSQPLQQRKELSTLAAHFELLVSQDLAGDFVSRALLSKNFKGDNLLEVIPFEVVLAVTLFGLRA